MVKELAFLGKIKLYLNTGCLKGSFPIDFLENGMTPGKSLSVYATDEPETFIVKIVPGKAPGKSPLPGKED